MSGSRWRGELVRLSGAVCLALSLAAMAAHAEDATVDSAWTIHQARAYHTAIKISDATRLWENFDETMRSGFGTVAKFEEVLKQIVGQVGRLESCLRERASLEGQYWVYRGDCRFSKSPVPLTLVFAFDQDGKTSGLWIKPEAKRTQPSISSIRHRPICACPFTANGRPSGVVVRSSTTTTPSRAISVSPTTSSSSGTARRTKGAAC